MADVVDKTKNPAKAQMPKKCPNCGMMNPFVRDTCRKCKTPLPEPKKVYVCIKCGEDMFEDEPKCPNCGLPIEEVIAQSQFNSTRSKDNF